MKSLHRSCTEKKKAAYICLFLAVGVLAAAVFSLCVGAVMISPAELLRSPADSVAGRILRYSRLPRTACSLLAGAALAVSGAIIQSVLANPLAAPNIIGINSGAGFMVSLCCAFAPVSSALSSPAALTPLAAFAGAMFGMLLVLGISEAAGASKLTLVLAGVAISSLFSAATDMVVTFVPDALAGYTDFRIGGFEGVTLGRLAPAAVLIGAALALAFSMSHSMDILALGSETAQSLGLSVRPVRLLLLAAAAALAAGAVSFAGLLGFVGLLVPHMIRRLLGADALPLLAGSALGGAILVTVCDTIARSLFSPYELSVGIVLSFIGAPFFLWLLFRQRGGRTHD